MNTLQNEPFTALAARARKIGIEKQLAPRSLTSHCRDRAALPKNDGDSDSAIRENS